MAVVGYGSRIAMIKNEQDKVSHHSLVISHCFDLRWNLQGEPESGV